MFCCRFFIISIICLGVLLQPRFVDFVVDTDKHLENFSIYNVHQHDNIDDESSEHQHTHRHSEDGEEHEHDHSHTKSTYQAELKFSSDSAVIQLASTKSIETESYTLRSFISSPHPLEIFRPPVS